LFIPDGATGHKQQPRVDSVPAFARANGCLARFTGG
jgi:hypothetical protein